MGKPAEQGVAPPLKHLLLLVVLAFPRVVLAALLLFSNYLQRAYQGILIPLIGFFFLPLTTLTYAWLINTGTPTQGVYLVVLLSPF